MLTVLSVGKSRVSPVLLTVAPSEGEPQKYGISEGEYLALGSPRPGDTLEGEREERLIALDEGHRARRAAANLLAFGDNNTASLMRKLKTRGFSHEAAEAATAAMVGRGYINEQAQLDRAVALAANRKLWGARRIADALTAKGYRFFMDSPTNQQFPILPDTLLEELKKEFCYSYMQSMGNGESVVRFCTSWATTEKDVDALLHAIPAKA